MQIVVGFARSVWRSVWREMERWVAANCLSVILRFHEHSIIIPSVQFYWQWRVNITLLNLNMPLEFLISSLFSFFSCMWSSSSVWGGRILKKCLAGFSRPWWRLLTKSLSQELRYQCVFMEPKLRKPVICSNLTLRIVLHRTWMSSSSRRGLFS